MASDLQSTLGRIITKSNVLIEKYRALEEEKIAADNKIEKLQLQVDSMKKELESLQRDNEYMRLARTIMPNADQLSESKAIIRQLVRDVDKCISQLT